LLNETKELIKLLKDKGYVFARQSGSHAIYKKDSSKIIIVLMHNRDIPIGTLNAIMKDAELHSK
jgi:predicted RNA binding protein YcfA (HicA-like mRNA interferase family)